MKKLKFACNGSLGRALYKFEFQFNFHLVHLRAVHSSAGKTLEIFGEMVRIFRVK